MSEKTRIIIEGDDRTKAAFASAARNIKGLQSGVEGLVAPLRAAGALAIATGAAFAAVSFKETIDAADELSKLSQRTGIAVESLSALRYAGKLADLSVDDLAGGLKKLNENISGAARGNAEQAAAFAAIGVAVKDASGNVRSAEEVLGDIADRFASYADGPRKVELANKLAGKSFERWIPLLNGGREGLRQAREELEKFGGVMSGQLGKDAERFNDNVTRLGVAAESLKVQLASGLLGRLADLSDEFVKNTRESGAFETSFKALRATLFGGPGLVWRMTFGTDDAQKNADALRDDVVAATKEVERLQRTLDKLNAGGDARAVLVVPRLEAAKQRLATAQAATVGSTPSDESASELARLKARSDARPKPDAPAIPDPGEAAALARKQLDAKLKGLSDGLAQFRDVEQFHEQFIKGLHDDGLVSLDTYYAHQAASREQSLQATRAALGKERALLEVQRKTLDKPSEQADITAKIADVDKRRADAEREASQAADLATQEKARAQRALQDNIASLDAQLASLAGNKGAGELLDIARQVRAARELLGKAGADPAKADKLDELLKQQQQFVVVRRDVERATDAAAVAEERLRLASEANGDGLVEAEQKVYAARLAALTQLDALIERTKALAAANQGDPELLAYLDQLRLAREKAAAVADPTQTRFSDAAAEGARSITDSFRDAVIEGGKLRDIINDLDKRLARLVLDEIAFKPIEEGLRGFLKPYALDFGKLATGGAGKAGAAAGVAGGEEAAAAGIKALGATATGGAEALGKMATQTSATSTVLSILPSAGATPATSAMASLTLAANAAAAALQAVAASSAMGGGSGAGGLASLGLSGANFAGGGFGSGAAYGFQDLGMYLHDGGVVGKDFAAKPSTFRDMQAGILLAEPLKMNERRAVLEVGEEVITREDPRHRANLTRTLLERTYHTGGIVGAAADALPLARAANAAMRGAELRGASAGAERAGDTYITHITVPAGTPRDTANQIGNRIAERAAFARRRNG